MCERRWQCVCVCVWVNDMLKKKRSGMVVQLRILACLSCFAFFFLLFFSLLLFCPHPQFSHAKKNRSRSALSNPRLFFSVLILFLFFFSLTTPFLYMLINRGVVVQLRILARLAEFVYSRFFFQTKNSLPYSSVPVKESSCSGASNPPLSMRP
jgi:hypothetical protein